MVASPVYLTDGLYGSLACGFSADLGPANPTAPDDFA
jgi:hypothetical protein